jgi:hypothetical protein
MEELEKRVKREIGLAFSWMDLDEISEIQDNILEEVCEDVMETSDYPNYNDSDIRIAIKRVIINLTSMGK